MKKVQRKLKDLGKGTALTVLALVGVSGILIAGALCPGLLQLIAHIQRKRISSRALYQMIVRLDKKGWIVARQTSSGWKIHLTKRGRKELEEYEFGHKHLLRPKTWDGHWRLLSFDVPERQKWRREKIRTVLRTLNFIRLQDSLWVYPFECQNVLDLLRTKYGVRNEALYIRAEHIDHDRWLKKEFDLS